jgi:hypothetical protein
MPYETIVDAAQILRSTLYILEHSEFPERRSKPIADVIKQLRTAVADLESSKGESKMRVRKSTVADGD